MKKKLKNTILYKMADDALYTVKHTSEMSSYLLYRDMEEFKKNLNTENGDEQQMG